MLTVYYTDRIKVNIFRKDRKIGQYLNFTVGPPLILTSLRLCTFYYYVDTRTTRYGEMKRTSKILYDIAEIAAHCDSWLLCVMQILLLTYLHSVTCHPAEVTFPAEACSRLSDPGGMQAELTMPQWFSAGIVLFIDCVVVFNFRNLQER